MLDVLEGRVTPETHLAVFQDDLLYFAVAILRQVEPTWLDEALAQDPPGAAHVRGCLPL